MKASRLDLIRMGVRIPDDAVTHRELDAGPWLAAFIVRVDTPVRSKSNFRRRQARGQQWSQVREFEDRLAAAILTARPASWPQDDASVKVAERHGVVGVCYARSVLDTANLPKSVYDAAEGILYVNDAQVRAETSMVDRGRVNPTLVCGFAAVDGAAPAAKLSVVTAALWEAVAAEVGQHLS